MKRKRETKRTWVVYVQMNCGHELNDVISESEWYGPFTRVTAEKLQADLNRILDNCDEVEHEEAIAMPLLDMAPTKILRRYRLAGRGSKEDLDVDRFTHSI